VSLQLRELAGTANVPPVDLLAVAGHLGIAEVHVAQCIGGNIVNHRGRGRVTLSRGAPRQQRFTLAHEIAHWVLDDPEEQFIMAGSRPVTPVHIEAFCDALAAALLVPRPWLEEQDTATPSMATVLDVATTAEVSVTCAFLRLSTVCGWRTSLVTYRRRGSSRQWRAMRLLHRTPQLRQCPDPSRELNLILSELDDGGGTEMFSGRLPLTIRGSSQSVSVEADARHGTAIVMCTPELPGYT
jgi:hypothetical protein